jgi:hypothetical protein
MLNISLTFDKIGCEKQESNLRTPSRIDLESIPVDHLGILALNGSLFF